MSKRNLLFLSILLIAVFSALNAQPSDWNWAVKAGGPNIDRGAEIALDNSGNSYVTGHFSDSITFGSTTLQSSGNQDLFVAKSDSEGNWLWAKKAGGDRADVSNSIAVDPAGNVYIVGCFNSATAYFGNIGLNCSVSPYNPNNIYYDIYIAKLDTNGNWLWADNIGGYNDDIAMSVTVGADSNVYLTGTYRYSLSVPTSPATTLTNSGVTDIFIAKMSSSGSWLWAQKAGGMSYENGNGIAVDDSGNVYFCGGFVSGILTLGSFQLVNPSSQYEAFVAKLDNNGNWLWAKRAGGNSSDQANAIAIDPEGNPIITGYIGGSASFGPHTLPLSGFFDVFVSKLDPNGNWLWASKAGGTDWDEALAISTDDNSNIHIAGLFENTCNFGSVSLTSVGAGTTDGFIGKMDCDGNWLDVVQTGGTEEDCSSSLSLDDSGDVFTCGDFCDTIQFGSYTLTSSGYSDLYITVLSDTGAQLELVAPNGGEIWYAGSTYEISWTSSNLSNVVLDYSLDYGASWNCITPSPIPANPEAFDWSVPAINGDQVLVRVSDADNPDISDTSDDVFSIQTPCGNLNLISGTTQDFGSTYINDPTDYQPVILTNYGSFDVNILNVHFMGNPLHFAYQLDDDALLITPGETDSIFVYFTPQFEGEHYDTLFIENDSGNTPVITIDLFGIGAVAPPCAPQQVTVGINNDDIELGWEPVSTNVLGEQVLIDHYAIFKNDLNDPTCGFVYLDLAEDNCYTHDRALQASGRTFYRIYAVELERASGARGAASRSRKEAFLRENLSRGMNEEEFKRILREARQLID